MIDSDNNVPRTMTAPEPCGSCAFSAGCVAGKPDDDICRATLAPPTADNQGVPKADSDANAREPDCGIVDAQQQADMIASPDERKEEVDASQQRSVFGE